MDFTKIRIAFKSRARDCFEYETAYQELRARAKEYVDAEPRGDWGDSKRIREYSLVLSQALLHRAEKLFSGALVALSDENPYSMILSIRGHFETTAVLGYLHHKLRSLSEGNIEPRSVDHDLCMLILGSRDKKILEMSVRLDTPLETKNILSLLEYADRTVSKHILKGKTKEHIILTDSYNFLCEFSHPNFHSNAAAFKLKATENRFYFRHDEKMTDDYFGTIDYLMLSHPIFIELFDKLPELLPQ